MNVGKRLQRVKKGTWGQGEKRGGTWVVRKYGVERKKINTHLKLSSDFHTSSMVCVCTHIHIRHAHTHVYMHMPTCILPHTPVYIHLLIYIPTYTHMYTYTCLHTHTLKLSYEQIQC